MIRDYKSDDLGKCCDRCCTEPGDEQFKERCPDHKTGEHKLVSWEMWVAVGSFTAYGTKSQADALQIFQEYCGGYGELARKLTPEEFHALRIGAARLEIAVIPTKKVAKRRESPFSEESIFSKEHDLK